MFAVDVSPLVLTPRTGGARALEHLLLGWSRLSDPEPLVLLAPGPVPVDTRGFELRQPRGGTVGSARSFRRVLPGLVREVGAEAFYSPWSAFPRLGIPVVALVHELPFVRHGPIEGRRRALVHRTWLRRNVARCAALVVPSRATGDDLTTLHPEARAKTHVIPHGFDPTPWARVEDRSDDRAPQVLMIGVGHGRKGARKKGLDLLLRAREASARLFGLVLVGTPALPVPDDVRVVACPDDAALRRLLAETTALAYPSRSEGFGYPPLEAMAAGLPVVASDAGSIPEVVGDAAVTVSAGDERSLQRALQEVVLGAGIHPRRDVREASGRDRARRFPPEVTADALQTVMRAARAKA